MKSSFGYRCEYCDGTVRQKRVQREAFKHKHGFVILENVDIGVCAQCGNRYYSADTLKRVKEIADRKIQPDRIEPIPVSREHK